MKNPPVSVLELVDCQVHLTDGEGKDGIFICTRFPEHILKCDPHKSITDVVMFDGASNVQLYGKVLKIHDPKVLFMRGVEHTVSFSPNNVPKVTIVNKMITSHKEIYNLFGSGIYHKPHSIFKLKSYDFHNRNISLFSGNDTRIDGYLIGIQIDLRIITTLLTTVSSYELNTMSLNSKLSKVISYIQDNKA